MNQALINYSFKLNNYSMQLSMLEDLKVMLSMDLISADKVGAHFQMCVDLFAELDMLYNNLTEKDKYILSQEETLV